MAGPLWTMWSKISARFAGKLNKKGAAAGLGRGERLCYDASTLKE